MLNDVPEGYAGPLPTEVPTSYKDFLRKCNGAVFGRLVLFDAEVVAGSQFYADPQEGTPVQLNRSDWFCFGKADEDPLFLERATGAVRGFPDTGIVWWQSERFEKLGDSLDSFLLDRAFGAGYREFTGAGTEDTWATVLQRLGRV
ncbi:hypothetical protein [Streptomyces sp. NBC_01500]|nr:hypothetical protein [Streptomyces sp. NBC_01500]MCX4550136.1 SMI1/KNR4 family protein [Streptomyces sp. NBC_01500]